MSRQPVPDWVVVVMGIIFVGTVLFLAALALIFDAIAG